MDRDNGKPQCLYGSFNLNVLTGKGSNCLFLASQRVHFVPDHKCVGVLPLQTVLYTLDIGFAGPLVAPSAFGIADNSINGRSVAIGLPDRRNQDGQQHRENERYRPIHVSFVLADLRVPSVLDATSLSKWTTSLDALYGYAHFIRKSLLLMLFYRDRF